MSKYDRRKDIAALNALDPDTRKVVQLYLDGQSYRGIAEQVGCSKLRVMVICEPFKALRAHEAWNRRKATLAAQIDAEIRPTLPPPR